jgi:hypothetical protein
MVYIPQKLFFLQSILATKIQKAELGCLPEFTSSQAVACDIQYVSLLPLYYIKTRTNCSLQLFAPNPHRVLIAVSATTL